MKPDDKTPKKMLDNIREQADKTKVYGQELFVMISELCETCPTYRSATLKAWLAFAFVSLKQAARIANEAKELADAGGETAEGGAE